MIIDLDRNRTKNETVYRKSFDIKCVQHVSKKTNEQYFNQNYQPYQKASLSRSNILNFSGYIEDIENSFLNKKENNQTINNDKTYFLSDVFDKEITQNQNDECKQNSFFQNSHENKSQKHTFLENSGLNQQQTTSFSQIDLKDEQKQGTHHKNYQYHKQEISAEWIFHQGVQAALKQFILNNDQKIQIYMSQKKYYYSKKLNQISQINIYFRNSRIF
ncbi:hypothetical protein TTHERM_00265140 (macronuclear) [Tetrahymena thermophila SB210]|uniref:Uncharacterized protein n=1 Tax=Tetrahymena thermophila (strain SB210) TaxID=312017 RepID=Q22TX7_TETTS|nr:hypothetical protein TTHERM_00265140 [Tetrahymena thermophila SB210]EAR88910.2 hypothetical protein TTHERM_00265140 [Tetrahymena thermophila SB210]|eukprot:XP_001009155.2 hypothetical protein TTHERM_00265140 [Tetrahymena thermophila SB210]